MYTFEQLRGEYEELLKTVQVTNQAAVNEGADLVMASMVRYKAASAALPNSPPAVFIGALDLRESSCDPSRGLGQGDRWDRPSVNEPAGCGPFASWLAAAKFYIHYDKLDLIPASQWTKAYACFRGEAWNGWGPRHEHGIRTGYLWGGTNHQQRGKYVSDHHYDPSVMDQQVGIVPVMLECIRRDPALDFGNKIGAVSPNAVAPPKPVLPPHAPEVLSFGQQVKKTMLALKLPWAPDMNVVSVEGRDPDGTPNKNRNNAFDDVKMVLDGDGKIIGGPWEATTQPGVYWTRHPMNEGGAFIIALGTQERIWEYGDYHGPAWRQKEDSTIMGFRDPHATYKREGLPIKHGYIGVHHHRGYDLNRDDIANAAAGCQVIRSNNEHLEFMRITRSCPRFMREGLTATVLTSDQITQANKVPVESKAATVVVASGVAATAAVADSHWDVWVYVGMGVGLVLVAIAVYYGIKWWRHK